MQIQTGEISEELSEEMEKLVKEMKQEEYVPRSVFPNSPPTKKKDMVQIAVGDVVEVKGVPCKIVHINPGKQRFSLHPIGKLGLGEKQR
jgi:hypothetical protein